MGHVIIGHLTAVPSLPTELVSAFGDRSSDADYSRFEQRQIHPLRHLTTEQIVCEKLAPLFRRQPLSVDGELFLQTTMVPVPLGLIQLELCV
ncbi:unnamed protein product [Protopolystoma xenopodis]|uniref:Uncharacterized protein n=1 Tax=Protopolystoma xenopodis TaxID=117903 RepID=A0A448XKE5_9PLAT|nr:unnamed protein product [Protopolystoma xenopodis]